MIYILDEYPPMDMTTFPGRVYHRSSGMLGPSCRVVVPLRWLGKDSVNTSDHVTMTDGTKSR